MSPFTNPNDGNQSPESSEEPSSDSPYTEYQQAEKILLDISQKVTVARTRRGLKDPWDRWSDCYRWLKKPWTRDQFAKGENALFRVRRRWNEAISRNMHRREMRRLRDERFRVRARMYAASLVFSTRMPPPRVKAGLSELRERVRVSSVNEDRRRLFEGRRRRECIRRQTRFRRQRDRIARLRSDMPLQPPPNEGPSTPRTNILRPHELERVKSFVVEVKEYRLRVEARNDVTSVSDGRKHTRAKRRATGSIRAFDGYESDDEKEPNSDTGANQGNTYRPDEQPRVRNHEAEVRQPKPRVEAHDDKNNGPRDDEGYEPDDEHEPSIDTGAGSANSESDSKPAEDNEDENGADAP